MRQVSMKRYEEEFDKLKEEMGKDGEIELLPFHGKENGSIVVVNWDAIGSVTPEYAVGFSERLKRSANLAASFKYNGYRVI